jgi:hypothetical protein
MPGIVALARIMGIVRAAREMYRPFLSGMSIIIMVRMMVLVWDVEIAEEGKG